MATRHSTTELPPHGASVGARSQLSNLPSSRVAAYTSPAWSFGRATIPRPPLYESGALPTELPKHGAADWIRTSLFHLTRMVHVLTWSGGIRSYRVDLHHRYRLRRAGSCLLDYGKMECSVRYDLTISAFEARRRIRLDYEHIGAVTWPGRRTFLSPLGYSMRASIRRWTSRDSDSQPPRCKRGALPIGATGPFAPPCHSGV